MADSRAHYRNPPVVEVICEISFGGSGWDSAVPGMFYDRIRDRFPIKQELQQVRAQFTLGPAGQSSAGFLPGRAQMQFLNEEGDRLVRLSQDVLVLNKQRPYSHFEEWERDIHHLIAVYREVAAPTVVQSLSIRYLNVVNLPGPIVPLAEYFTVYPHLPASFENHGPFMVRFLLMPEDGHELVVTFASAPAESAATYSFVLDLLNRCSNASFETLSEELRRGHEHLVVAFQESCTQALKDMFEPEVIF